jgi:hypothetical protein
MRFYNQIVARIGNPAAASEPTEDLMPQVNLPDINLDDPTATPDFDTTEYPGGLALGVRFQAGSGTAPRRLGTAGRRL